MPRKHTPVQARNPWTPAGPLHRHTEAPSGSDSSGAPAASSAGTRRNALVLTPAKDCRQHSVPHNFMAKRAKTTKTKNKDTSDNSYEVSLGTESDDFPEDDPDWWKKPLRSEVQGRSSVRTSSVTLRRGRTPPPGFPQQGRSASRNKSVDEKDL